MNKREILLSIVNPFKNDLSRWIVKRETRKKLKVLRPDSGAVINDRLGNVIDFSAKKMEKLSLRKPKDPTNPSIA